MIFSAITLAFIAAVCVLLVSKKLNRAKIGTNTLAKHLAELALRPFENPSEQDKNVRKQAEGEGVWPDRFTFEAVALQCYTTGAVINRERLEGRINFDTAELLVKQFMTELFVRLEGLQERIWEVMKIDAQSAFSLILARGEKYVRPAYGEGSIEDVQRMFAEFCGAPDSNVLERLGWSMFQIRGDNLGSSLKRMRIIPQSA